MNDALLGERMNYAFDEERSARAFQRRALKARRARVSQLETERWRRFKDYRRGKRCHCAIRRGMTFDELCGENLRGRQPERANCADPDFVCPVLGFALSLTHSGGRL